LDHKEIQYSEQLEEDLIENFRLMHSIKLMHRDIKPNNILYSKRRQKHIFCDFGISHFVNENVGK
jgi:serine/threonine protein kinase